MEKRLVDETLADYLRLLGSIEPAPGGGSCAAYVAAMALALFEKSVICGNRPAELLEQAEDTLARSNELRQWFLEKVDEDAIVFNECVSNKSLDFRQRFEPARQISLAMVSALKEALGLLKKGKPFVNKNLANDYLGAISLLQAALRISEMNSQF